MIVGQSVCHVLCSFCWCMSGDTLGTRLETYLKQVEISKTNKTELQDGDTLALTFSISLTFTLLALTFRTDLIFLIFSAYISKFLLGDL